MPSNEQINEAIERLVKAGKPVTTRKIRKELGDTGSHEQILPVLAAWREAQAMHTNLQSEIPQALADRVTAFLTECWALSQKKATEEAEDFRRGADQRVTKCEAELVEVTRELDECEHQVETLQHHAAAATIKEELLRDSLNKALQTSAAATREITMLREIIAELKGEMKPAASEQPIDEGNNGKVHKPTVSRPQQSKLGIKNKSSTRSPSKMQRKKLVLDAVVNVMNQAAGPMSPEELVSKIKGKVEEDDLPTAMQLYKKMDYRRDVFTKLTGGRFILRSGA